MGMDVYGRNRCSKEGEYFRNNVWWWRPRRVLHGGCAKRDRGAV